MTYMILEIHLKAILLHLNLEFSPEDFHLVSITLRKIRMDPDESSAFALFFFEVTPGKETLQM